MKGSIKSGSGKKDLNQLKKIIVIIGILLALLAVAVANAQTLYNNHLFYVKPGTTVGVNGPLQNKMSFENDGKLILRGDYTNTAAYGGAGELILAAETYQKYAVNGEKVNILKIAGGGEKVLEGKVNVNTSLLLGEGKFNTKQGELIISSSADLLGGNASSYIFGPVYFIGTGFKYAPVGTEDRYLPIELLDVKGVEPTLSVEAGTWMKGSTIKLHSSVKAFQDDFSWKLSLAGGTFFGSPVFIENYEGHIIQEANAILTFNPVDSVQEISDVVLEGSSMFSKSDIKQGIFSMAVVDPVISEEITIPNALRPNATDAEDRVIKIYGQTEYIDSFSFSVFNSWGQEVFKSTSLSEMKEKGWNGTANNMSRLEAGAYIFNLFYRLLNGEEVHKTGTINLFR